MTRRATWWKDSGEFLTHHPELLAAAREVHGFGRGGQWMHRAMTTAGWRMPPFAGCGKYEWMGWLKYGICGISTAIISAVVWAWAGPWWLPWLMIIVFYATEAQMVFLFPEALLGRRAPWLSARALTVTAGGTFQVMITVLPIAVGMLGAGWWRGKAREKWVQGCMAVILWHRQVAVGRKGFTEDPLDLQKLEIGPVSPLFLRREFVKLAGCDSFKVLWISDLHWRGMGDAGTLMALLEIVRQEKPTVCILGGDFLESPRALPLLRTLIKSISRVARCVALPGNHDRGRRCEMIAAIVREAGACWLPDVEQFEVTHRNGEILEIVGHAAAVKVGSGTCLIAVHDPSELDDHPPAEGSLVLAGHLHGGQYVISSKDGRLLPAAWFYQHAWTRRSHAGSEWIVSLGAGDTLPIRWNCPREIIICEIL